MAAVAEPRRRPNLEVIADRLTRIEEERLPHIEAKVDLISGLVIAVESLTKTNDNIRKYAKSIASRLAWVLVGALVVAIVGYYAARPHAVPRLPVATASPTPVVSP